LTPSITQSVGVPVVAKRRSDSCRTRIGSASVSARLAPDCSYSRRAHPDVVGQLGRDPLQRFQPVGMDAVIIGEEDPHALPPMWVMPGM
jgi:hypothetical protein